MGIKFTSSVENPDKNMPSEKNPYGLAKILEEKEYMKLTSEGKPLFQRCDSAMQSEGIIVGRSVESNKVISIPTKGGINRCSAMLAPPGGGKTRTYINNMILSFAKQGHSMVVYDPKGSIMKMMAAMLRGKYGYDVKIVNYKNMENSNSWAMLKECETVKGTMAFSSFFMSYSGEADVYFDGVVSNLLKVLSMFVWETYPENKRNFAEVRRLLNDPVKMVETLEEAVQSDNRRWANAYRIFKASGNAVSSAISGLGNRTDIWDMPEVCNITSTDELDFEQIAKKKTVLFVCVPDTEKTYNAISSTLMAVMMKKIFDYADSTPNEETDVPVDVIIDEFPTLGKIDGIERYFATGRSRNIGIHIIAQNIPQMYEVYGENLTENILSLCKYICGMKTNSYTTAEYLSRLYGETTTKMTSHSYANNGSLFVPATETSESQSVSQTKVIYPSNIMNMADERLILKVEGKEAIFLNKMDMAENPDSLDLFKVHTSEIIPPWRIQKNPTEEMVDTVTGEVMPAVSINDFLEWVYLNKSEERQVVKDSERFGPQRTLLLKERKKYVNLQGKC